MTTEFNKVDLKTLNDFIGIDPSTKYWLEKELMKYKEHIEKTCNCIYCTGQRNFIEYFLGLWDGK